MKNLCSFLLILFLTLQTKAQNIWEQVVSGTSQNLFSISFGTPAVGYIGGADSTLLKTTDGGVTWTAVNYSGLTFGQTEKDIIHLNFINADTGFAIISNLFPYVLGFSL